jgi:transposase
VVDGAGGCGLPSHARRLRLGDGDLRPEIGDVRRFENPRQLMTFLDLVRTERSTGESIRRGGLTLTGNRRIRRALMESAWSY